MIKKYFAMTIIAASVSLAACSDDDDDDTPVVPETPVVLPDVTDGGGSAFDTIAGSADHTTLLAAIQSITDLDKTLDNPASTFTVFAPTNAAFDALLAASEDDAFTETADFLADENEAAVLRILQGHVVPSLATSAEVVAAAGDGSALATLASDAALTFAATTTDPAATSGFDVIGAVEGAAPIALNSIDLGEDLTAGVVHSIDTVISVPPAAEEPAPEEPAPEEPGPETPAPTNGAADAAIAALGTSEIFRSALARDFGGSLDAQAWTFFVPSDAALTAAGLTDLTAAQQQAHIVSAGPNDPATLGALTTILASNNVSYAVTNEGGAITVDGKAVALIATGDAGAQIYSIDGVLGN